MVVDDAMVFGSVYVMVGQVRGGEGMGTEGRGGAWL